MIDCIIVKVEDHYRIDDSLGVGNYLNVEMLKFFKKFLKCINESFAYCSKFLLGHLVCYINLVRCYNIYISS